MMFGSAESEHRRLTNGEIISDVSTYVITIHQRYRNFVLLVIYKLFLVMSSSVDLSVNLHLYFAWFSGSQLIKI